MEPRYLTREQVREIDRRAIEELGIPGLVLMENAGRGCVDVMERIGIDDPVVVLCGRGNNAGDGFVIARHLKLRGYTCSALLLASPDALTSDAGTNFDAMHKLSIPYNDLSPFVNDKKAFDIFLEYADGGISSWIVDAMLGTGAKGEPRWPYSAAIDWMNSRPVKRLAVDLPSGLDCDTGQPSQHTVRANHTCTFVAQKIGFRAFEAQEYLGQVHVLDIGVPAEW